MEWKTIVEKELERVRGELQSHRKWKRSVEQQAAQLRQQGFHDTPIFDRLLQGIEAHIVGFEGDERVLADWLDANDP